LKELIIFYIITVYNILNRKTKEIKKMEDLKNILEEIERQGEILEEKFRGLVFKIYETTKEQDNYLDEFYKKIDPLYNYYEYKSYEERIRINKEIDRMMIEEIEEMEEMIFIYESVQDILVQL